MVPCGGAGEPGSRAGMAVPAPEAPPVRIEEAAGVPRDPAWDAEVLPYIEEEETMLAVLARAIADAGKQAPVFGYELDGTSAWQVDFAWPTAENRVAVVTNPTGEDDLEARRRDQAFSQEGWTVRSVSDWLDHLDSLLALLPAADPAATREGATR